MDWKNNKLIGVGGTIIILICIISIGSFFIFRIQENLREKKRQRQIQQTEEYKQWKAYEERGE